MRARLVFDSYDGKWVVINMTKIVIFLLILAWTAAPCYSMDESSASVTADAIRAGCVISFSKEFYPVQGDPLSSPPFSIVSLWKCRDGEKLPIDRYGVNGSSPDVVTVFYWKRRDVVVLVKWQINSEAADYSGSYYEIFAYTYTNSLKSPRFVRDNGLMKYFPAGFDGVAKDGALVVYPFKDASSIREKLRSVDFK